MTYANSTCGTAFVFKWVISINWDIQRSICKRNLANALLWSKVSWIAVCRVQHYKSSTILEEEKRNDLKDGTVIR
jgi:hypothetical protein